MPRNGAAEHGRLSFSHWKGRVAQLAPFPMDTDMSSCHRRGRTQEDPCTRDSCTHRQVRRMLSGAFSFAQHIGTAALQCTTVHHCAPQCVPPARCCRETRTGSLGLPGALSMINTASGRSIASGQWPRVSLLGLKSFALALSSVFFLLNLPLVLLPLVLLPLSVVPLGALRLCDLHCLSYRSVGETYRCSLLGPCISHCCCCCMEVALCAVV